MLESNKRKLGIVIASAISSTFAMICILFGIIGGNTAANQSLSLERDRHVANAYPWASRISEVAFQANWAFIEGIIKPDLGKTRDLAFFYVVDQNGTIKVTNIEEFAGKGSEEIKNLWSTTNKLDNTPVQLLGMIYDPSSMSLEQLKLQSSLRSEGGIEVPKGIEVLHLYYPLVKDTHLVGAVGFGFDIQHHADDLFRMQSIAIVISILIAIVMGFLTFNITNAFVGPLNSMSDELANFNDSTENFEEKLKKLDLSQAKTTSREIAILKETLIKFQQIILTNLSQISQLRTSEAIALTTQMIAHDVRRPFTMVQAISSLLSQSTTPEETKDIIERMLPELNRTINSVNRLLQDIMEVGSKAALQWESTSIPDTVNDSLVMTFDNNKHHAINIFFEFKHRHQIQADRQKLQRVFVNIFNNANQAMKGIGTLTIKSEELADSNGEFVTIEIGNTGSSIDSNDLPHVFDAFYTKGKKTGTGLGLAIAKKIMSDHGGDITCKSTNQGVFFLLTFKSLSKTLDSVHQGKPTLLSQNIVSALVTNNEFNERAETLDSNQIDSIRTELTRTAKIINQPLRIVFVDNEVAYRDQFEKMIHRILGKDNHLVLVSLFETAESALLHINSSNFDALITDIDFGDELFSGFDLISRSSEKAVAKALICIHTNRLLSLERGLSNGNRVDLFLPKPLKETNLRNLLIMLFERVRDNFPLK
ncbi:MAG: hybrid sensor histidine kinase/response regulator [Proteobacteria bacterium]|nr:hybrid sensor histidine kinase/response regulator [Pseudomonadota bacterium]